jgi:hypothetical protein
MFDGRLLLDSTAPDARRVYQESLKSVDPNTCCPPPGEVPFPRLEYPFEARGHPVSWTTTSAIDHPCGRLLGRRLGKLPEGSIGYGCELCHRCDSGGVSHPTPDQFGWAHRHCRIRTRSSMDASFGWEISRPIRAHVMMSLAAHLLWVGSDGD